MSSVWDCQIYLCIVQNSNVKGFIIGIKYTYSPKPSQTKEFKFKENFLPFLYVHSIEYLIAPRGVIYSIDKLSTSRCLSMSTSQKQQTKFLIWLLQSFVIFGNEMNTTKKYPFLPTMTSTHGKFMKSKGTIVANNIPA